jgi:hypothetical protein
MVVNQAVGTPIISVPVATPNISSRELLIYSDRTVFQRWLIDLTPANSDCPITDRMGRPKSTPMRSAVHLSVEA